MNPSLRLESTPLMMLSTPSCNFTQQYVGSPYPWYITMGIVVGGLTFLGVVFYMLYLFNVCNLKTAIQSIHGFDCAFCCNRFTKFEGDNVDDVNDTLSNPENKPDTPVAYPGTEDDDLLQIETSSLDPATASESKKFD